MTIKAAAQLSNLNILYRAITAFEPKNEIERETRDLLLQLFRARRSELRRELIKERIRQTGRVA